MAFYCVDYINGSDSTGNGTPAAPFKSIAALENFINSGAGFIVGDEVRIADNSTRTLVGTGTVTGQFGNITTTANYTSSIDIFTPLILEGSSSGLIPVPYRSLISVTATTLTFGGNNNTGSSTFNGTQLLTGETVNIYRIENPVTFAVTAFNTALDNFVNKNYNFNPDTESVVISGGWTPGNFTTKTLQGVTTFTRSSLSTFQNTSVSNGGYIFRCTNQLAGFVFKDFAHTNSTLINSSVIQNFSFKRLENIRFGYIQIWDSVPNTSSTTAYSSYINNCHFTNIDLANRFVTLTQQINSVIYYEDNIHYVSFGYNLYNWGLTSAWKPLGSTTTNDILQIVIRNITIRSTNANIVDGIKGINIAALLGQVQPSNWSTINLVNVLGTANNLFALQGGGGSINFRIRDQFNGFGPTFGVSPVNLNCTIPSAWVGKLNSLYGETPFNGTGSPYTITYPGDLSTISPLFGRTNINNNPSNITNWVGSSQGGARLIGNNGVSNDTYPTGYGSIKYNTVDQFSGDNCLEFTSWYGTANGRYGPGLALIYLNPGQSVTFSAKCKIKTGSSLSTLNASIRSIGGLNIGTTTLNTVINPSFNINTQQFSTPTAINNSTWTDISVTVTNNGAESGNYTQPKPYIFGLDFNFGTNVTTTVLIDSYQYLKS
jgi:hypothetical protein